MADLKAVAEQLVAMSHTKNALPEIVRLFREEFGIDLIAILTEGLDDAKALSAEDLKEEVLRLTEQANKQTIIVTSALDHARKIKPYVPRKIGNPRGFPPNMRRRK